MKFDTIIIGGGLSGLAAGIELSRKGQKCLIVSSGQSALHFFSGSLELYGNGTEPFKTMESLGPEHPYSKIGLENVKRLAERVKPFFKTCRYITCMKIQETVDIQYRNLLPWHMTI